MSGLIRDPRRDGIGKDVRRDGIGAAQADGPVIVIPPPIRMVLRTVNPEVVLGPVVVTPEPARMVLRAEAPAVILGPIFVTPSAMRLVLRTQSAAVVLGPVVVIPPPIRIVLRTQPAYVTGDPLVVVPPPMRLVLRTQDATVVLGDVTVKPDPVRVVLRNLTPPVILGGVTMVPLPVRLVLRSAAAEVVLPRYYGAVNYRVSLVTDRIRRTPLSVTERTARRLKIELFDENGLAIDGLSITRARLWVVAKTPNTVIRGGTEGEDIKSLFSPDGKAEILLTASDNRLVTTHPMRLTETHIVSFDIQVASRNDVLAIRPEEYITIVNLRSVA